MPTKKKPSGKKKAPARKPKAATPPPPPAPPSEAKPLAPELEALLSAETPHEVSVPPAGFVPPPAVVPEEQRVPLDVDAARPATLAIRPAAEAHDMPIDHAEPRPSAAAPAAPPSHGGPSRFSQPRRMPRPAVHLSLYRKLATTFIGLAILLLGFVLYLSFTRATVAVTRAPLPVSTAFTVTVSPEPADAEAVPGAVLETVVEGTRTVQASGEKRLVEGKACGAVTIINTQSRTQALVATTRLLSPEGVLFRLESTVSVPADGRLETRACADQPGAAGDIDPTRFTIPGLPASLQELTYAVSTASMTGGAREVSVVTQEELDAAYAAAAKEVAAEAADKLKGLLSRPEVGSGVFFKETIVRRETTAAVGQQQAAFDVTVAVHVEAVFYEKDALARVAEAQLRAAAPEDKEIVRLDAERLEVALAGSDLAAKSATLSVTAYGEAALKESSEAFDRERLTGLSLEEAEAQLESADGVSDAEIKVTPAWLKRVPNLADHIDLEFR